MAELKVSKVVSALPATLVADTIYIVRVGAGFDLYVTNSSGAIAAYSLNVSSTATSVFADVVSTSATSLTLTPAHQGKIIVLSANTTVVIGVPANTLPANFYCRVLSISSSGGFRVSASNGVTVGSPIAGFLAVRSVYADADIYAIGSNAFVMKSGYLSPAFTLNSIPTKPLIAVSTSRRISDAYPGNIMEVRRTDNTVQGIGWSGDAMDITSLGNFVGSGSGYVKTLYDQSGNNRHLTQSNNDRQPRIVNSGTLEQAGNHAAIRALNTGTWLDTALAVTGSSLTIAVVGVMNAATNNYGRLASVGQSGTNDYDNNQYSALIRRRELDNYIRTDRSSNQYGDSPITPGSVFWHSVRWDGNTVVTNTNGIEVTRNSANGNFNTSTFRIFAAMQLGNEFWDGYLCEMVVYDTALIDSQLTTIVNDWKPYFSLSA